VDFPAGDDGDRSMPRRRDRTWYVYVVECADGTLYTGMTNDVARRVAEHNKGCGARYTRGRRPVALVHQEQVGGRGAALRREAQIKRMRRREKEGLIRKQ
jgi:putative endonuclease